MADLTAAETLMIKPGTAVWMSHPSRITVLEPWPKDTSQVGDVSRAGVVLVFADDPAVLRIGLARALGEHPESGSARPLDVSLWVLHKGRPGPEALNRFSAAFAEYGLEPTEHVAINGRWAALRVS